MFKKQTKRDPILPHTCFGYFVFSQTLCSPPLALVFHRHGLPRARWADAALRRLGERGSSDTSGCASSWRPEEGIQLFGQPWRVLPLLHLLVITSTFHSSSQTEQNHAQITRKDFPPQTSLLENRALKDLDSQFAFISILQLFISICQLDLEALFLTPENKGMHLQTQVSGVSDRTAN